MSRETYDPRVQCPGGQFKRGEGGSCDTMTPFLRSCDRARKSCEMVAVRYGLKGDNRFYCR